jgi:tetratricopeptide (TPR) repeat protein
MVNNIQKYTVLLLLLSLSAVACKPGASVQGNTLTGIEQESIEFQNKFFAGQSEKAIGNPQKAYGFFQEALQLSPANDATMYEIARLDAEFGNLDQAAQVISLAIALDEKNEWYRKFHADILYEMGNMAAAQKQYEALIKLNPKNDEAYYQLANTYLSREDGTNAIKVYDQLEKKIGITEEISLQKQSLYLALNKPEKAFDEIKKLANAYPDEVRYQGMMAQYFLDIGDAEKAMDIYEKIGEKDPGNGMLHMKLSEYYAMTGDDARSYDELKLAFASNDISIDQKINILLKFFTLTDVNPEPLQLDRAYELLHICEETHPGEAKSYAMFGDFLARESRLLEARDKYRQALDLDKSRSAIWQQLLSIDSDLQDYEAMRADGDEAASLFPTLPEFYLYSGIANVQLKDYEAAVRALNSGRNLVLGKPAMSAQFYASLGDAYHALKNHEESDKSYDKSLEYQPDNVFVLNNYAYYLSLRKKNLPKAAEMAKRANELQPGEISFEDTYAWVLYCQNDLENAKLWLEKAFSHGGDAEGELLEHYGDVLFKMGQKDEAMSYWQKALIAGGGSEGLEDKISKKSLNE